MNKTMKIISLVLIVAYMTLFSLQTNAANYNAHTITIKSENFGHTFEAYQIFKGDLSDGKLTNVEWGLSIVNQDDLLNELKSLDAYVNCSDAMDVAQALESASASQCDEFASIVSNYLGEYAGGIMGGVPNADGYYHYAISVSGDGYYLIKDRDNSVSGNDAYTKYILEVVGDVEVVAKTDYPTLTKTLENGETVNAVSIGDEVNFVLESSVPRMDGYEKYYFVISDTYGEAFTFNNDVKVMLGENELVNGVDYEVIVEDEQFEIVFIDFISKADLNGSEIVITYSCTLDEDAVSGANGNSNSATLTYSNHPNFDYEGENTPLNNEPVGVTPTCTTTTYTGDLVITKVDGNSKELLANASFKISGSNLNKVQLRQAHYTASDTGTFYKLKDGTYTSSIPTDTTSSLYESTTQKYSLSYETTFVDSTSEEAIGIVDTSGTLTFKGLAPGTYTISEISAPEGYNKLDSPITVTVEFKDLTWFINGDSSIRGITVENFAGTVLPSTGGIGTVVFYILGSGLVLASVWLSKKK